MLVTPERRMSSWVMTKMAADASDNRCSFFAAEVTRISISCSISREMMSVSVEAGCMVAPAFAVGSDTRRNTATRAALRCSVAKTSFIVMASSRTAHIKKLQVGGSLPGAKSKSEAYALLLIGNLGKNLMVLLREMRFFEKLPQPYR